MNARPDVQRLQLLDEPVPVDREPVAAKTDDVEMPGMADPGTCGGSKDLGVVGETFIVHRSVPLADAEKCLRLLELLETDCRGDVGHVVFVARIEDFVIPRAL